MGIESWWIGIPGVGLFIESSWSMRFSGGLWDPGGDGSVFSGGEGAIFCSGAAARLGFGVGWIFSWFMELICLLVYLF